MNGDIVERLAAEFAPEHDRQIVLSTTVDADLLRDAKAEIELLRAALALAVGELSTYGEHRHANPVALMQEFLKEACREHAPLD